MMKKIIIAFACCSLFNLCKAQYTSYVDPFIGTGFHGHVFLGANVPFGAVQLGPVNIKQGWDWCSGYHYSDSIIIGFSHTHLSGTGIGDLGDILVMPAVGPVRINKNYYNSSFSHNDEVCRPGYYSVNLKRYNIKAELTATERVGFHQYTFPQSSDAKLIFDLKEGIGWDRPTDTKLWKLNDTIIQGYRYSTGWAKDQKIYFTAVFSKPMSSFSEDTMKAVIGFSTVSDEKIKLKVGISPASVENAGDNIKSEIRHWDFAAVATNADAAWNNELSKIAVKAKDEKTMRTFYTALYHTMIAPSIFDDHNSKETFTNYTTFSLWDTYRAAHPLLTLYQNKRVNDMINSMLAIYKQQGKLPVWHLMGNETNTMPGNSGIHVVVDAYLKGFRGFDTALAWEAVKNTAMGDERGLNYVKKYGFIPADSMVESAAMGLEYAIADWGISRMAKAMGKNEDYEYFSKRAKNYCYYFDPVTKFMRGRVSKKEWRTPFSPFEAKHMKDDFSEGNAWQYTWLVPQDVNGLMDLLGGKEAFTKKLDSLFVIKGDMGKEASADITGLIGQYAHGNEPSHHIAYLYALAGQPWKTAEKVRYILNSLYSDKIDGLCGNEDVGQMSAWYVLSALGLYQVNPAGGPYVFGSPIIDEATIRTSSGKTLHITVKNNSAVNKYLQRIILNGKKFTQPFISYKDIIAGGELVITMGPKPPAK